MTCHHLMCGLATGLALFAGQPAMAQMRDFNLSGSLLLSSNYFFRSLSQTSDEPQVRGDLTVSHSSGLYAGLWASNTDVGGIGNSVEVDPYVGYARDLGNGFYMDAGFWYYSYPGSQADLDSDGALESASYDYWELYAILDYTHDMVTVSSSIWYADNYFGRDFFPDTSSLAYDGTVAVALPYNITVSGRLGRQTLDEQAGTADQDYTYYDLGASISWQSLTFGLRWYDASGVDSLLAAPATVGGVTASLTHAF